LKIEQALVYYLLKTKQLTLQGIGTFHLDASVPDYVDSDKPVFIPENAITFNYDTKVTEDEGLIDFIVEHTNKIKPLAASDLDSFLSLARQFLNIGKPLTLQNIGTLEKLNSGILAFKPGQLIAQKIEPNKVRDGESEGEQQEENLFNDYQKARKSRTGAQLLVVLLVLIILGAIGWTIWHFIFDKKNEPENLTSTEQIVPIRDSAFKSDSTIIANSQTTQKNSTDSISFNIVINEYPTKPAAEWRLKKLQSLQRNAILYTNDSVTYKIAEPFTLPLSDTTRILDSLKRYYSKAYVEVK
jgi:flagellar basal body-associated protein FliL/nucleoid DNA-binding protein